MGIVMFLEIVISENGVIALWTGLCWAMKKTTVLSPWPLVARILVRSESRLVSSRRESDSPLHLREILSHLLSSDIKVDNFSIKIFQSSLTREINVFVIVTILSNLPILLIVVIIYISIILCTFLDKLISANWSLCSLAELRCSIRYKADEEIQGLFYLVQILQDCSRRTA